MTDKPGKDGADVQRIGLDVIIYALVAANDAATKKRKKRGRK